MSANPELVVCRLTPRGAEEQALEWVDLQQLALSAAPLAAGAQMRFPAEQAERIAGLAEREAACCTFLAIATRVEGEVCVVEITSQNPDALPVIAALRGVDLP